MQRIECVLQARRVPGLGWYGHGRLPPVGSQEECPLEPWNRQVKFGTDVEIVASDGSVDEVLGEREHEPRRDRHAELRSDVGECFDGRLQVLEVLNQVVLSVVDQPGGGVAEHAQMIESGRQARSLLEQHIESGRYLAQRLGENVALSGECDRKPVQRPDGVDDVVPLIIQSSHERVEARNQITEGALVPGQGGGEIVDDLPDLPQPPTLTTAPSDDSVCSVDG
jgi:hypothetical protein